MPHIWHCVDVETVKQLGKLRELLEASPSIALHIKDFSFSWSMGEDYMWFDDYPQETGTLLELAFRDRFQVWDDLRTELEATAKWHRDESPPILYFKHGGVEYTAPGRCHAVEGQFRQLKYDRKAPREGADGPDGDGEDERIKTPEQLIDCAVEVVGKLASLQKFSWTTPVLPMPAGVFQALSNLTTPLNSLHLDLTKARSHVQACKCFCDVNYECSCADLIDFPPSAARAVPFWKLAGNLRDLGFSFSDLLSHTKGEIEEQDETSLGSFELPAQLPTSKTEQDALRFSVAYRTIITAARGSSLRRLKVTQDVQHPFAIRTLLPCWMLLEERQGLSWFEPTWQLAACSLRPFFSHASLWFGVESGTSERQDRTFTREEVQLLRAMFKGAAMPRITPPLGQDQAILRYLVWMEQDEELAQRVVDAWNAIEGRGEADKVHCGCLKCRPRWVRQAQAGGYARS